MTSIAEPDRSRPGLRDLEPTEARRLRSRQRQILGAALVILSTAAIAIVPSFAKLAYEGGSDTLTVITGRSLVTAGVCFLAALATSRSLRMRRRALLLSLVLGALYAVHLYAFLDAVVYQPVNMVVLIYYLHPLMIGVAAIVAGREALSRMRLGALMAAFAGLALAVGFSLDDLSLAGVALSSIAALLAAVVVMKVPRSWKAATA